MRVIEWVNSEPDEEGDGYPGCEVCGKELKGAAAVVVNANGTHSNVCPECIADGEL